VSLNPNQSIPGVLKFTAASLELKAGWGTGSTRPARSAEKNVFDRAPPLFWLSKYK